MADGKKEEQQNRLLYSLIEREKHKVDGALKAATSIETGWRVRLMPNKAGHPLAVVANALIALRSSPEWSGLLGWDELSCRKTMSRETPWGLKPGGHWGEEQDVQLAAWLQHEGILVGPATAGQAAQTVAMENQHNPIHDYLLGLKWDGVKRVDDWMVLYLGAEPGHYIRSVGSLFLIASVARALCDKPVKADCVPVLEGEQGIGKSTAAAALFNPWFTDHLPDLSTKDAYQQLFGVWCVELAEMDTIRRAEITKVKAFLSSRVDRYRPPYGKHVIERRRRNVFIGTVNKSTWLSDETGGRRFWPVKCGKINTQDLLRDRDQLWAEAVLRYQSGAKWWIDDPEIEREAKKEQSGRYERGQWDKIIEAWIENRESVTVSDILTDCIQKQKQHWTQGDYNAVARCLRHQGWVQRRGLGPSGVTERRYYRPQE